MATVLTGPKPRHLVSGGKFKINLLGVDEGMRGALVKAGDRHVERGWQRLSDRVGTGVLGTGDN